MKIRQMLACVLLLALVAATLTACKYRLRWVKEETTVPVTEVPETTTLPEPTTVPEPTTEDTGIHEVAFVQAPYDKPAVMELYKKALGEVKIRCPGFTRTQYMITEDVSAAKGRLDLANRLLERVTKELLRVSGGEEKKVTVAPMDELAVLERFPAYGKAVGCDLANYEIVTSAVCYTDGTVYKIVITVEDTLNADPEKGDFCKIMTPVSRESIGEGLFFVSGSGLEIDLDYTGNEIVCELDAATGRLLSLTQKSVVEVDADLDLDLLLFRTDLVEARGTVIRRLEFTDFIWE